MGLLRTKMVGLIFIFNQWGMMFVRIPSGSFIMGSPENQSQRDDDEIQHNVTLTQDYFMQTTEVTQGQWKAIKKSNPLKAIWGPTKGSDRVIRGVSWLDMAKYCRSAERNRCGQGFALRHLGFRLCAAERISFISSKTEH